MANLADLALREAALKTLHDTIGAQLKTVKAEMQTALENTGASQVRALLPDGTRVGTTSLTVSKTAAHVVDQDAFLDWVRETAPSEVTTRTITEVRPAYLSRLLEQVTTAGVAEIPDRETGEIVDVPGVEVRAGRATTHSVRIAKGGAEAIAEAWRRGELAHLDLPQLMPGGARDA